MQRNDEGGLHLAVPDEFVELVSQRVVDLLRDQAPDTDPWLDVGEAAEYLRCGGRQRIYDLVHQGRLTPGRDGTRVLFRRSSLDAYLETGA